MTLIILGFRGECASDNRVKNVPRLQQASVLVYG